ncbi:MAG: hypothetical protein QG608_3884 [Actinomycetota bacterium]|nr:hypothetical protein [Actinomycetota bacterium]
MTQSPRTGSTVTRHVAVRGERPDGGRGPAALPRRPDPIDTAQDVPAAPSDAVPTTLRCPDEFGRLVVGQYPAARSCSTGTPGHFGKQPLLLTRRFHSRHDR